MTSTHRSACRTLTDQRPEHCILIIRLRLRLAGMERVELPVSPSDVHMRFNRVTDSGLIINMISVHEDPSAAPSREPRKAWGRKIHPGQRLVQSQK